MVEATASSPRGWGCFSACWSEPSRTAVFPTRVGVFLLRRRARVDYPRLPHAGGGVSVRLALLLSRVRSSPRGWGCFHTKRARQHVKFVFPTRVGGVSCASLWPRKLLWSSPRGWGCFRALNTPADVYVVFPTRVGVFLLPVSLIATMRCLPHAGGASSRGSSPRRWGGVSSGQ